MRKKYSKNYMAAINAMQELTNSELKAFILDVQKEIELSEACIQEGTEKRR